MENITKEKFEDSSNKLENITKEIFEAYLNVQHSGRTNMFNISNVKWWYS